MAHLYSHHWKDYELIDAGDGKKLERWGEVITIRPERNAYFRAQLPFKDWKIKADFEFVEETKSKGEWVELSVDAPRNWSIDYRKIKLNLHLTSFKHTGLFPEQQANWDFIENNIQDGDRFLNLFGYTGASSLVARANGADVFHCDSVKQVITWGRENMEASELSDIHWVLEDALKFAQREVKRGKKYKGIIMDPPAFGMAANKKRWKIETRLPELLRLALQLREKDGFVIVNTYSPKLDIKDIVHIAMGEAQGETIGVDTLCIKTSTGKVIEYGQRMLVTE